MSRFVRRFKRSLRNDFAIYAFWMWRAKITKYTKLVFYSIQIRHYGKNMNLDERGKKIVSSNMNRSQNVILIVHDIRFCSTCESYCIKQKKDASFMRVHTLLFCLKLHTIKSTDRTKLLKKKKELLNSDINETKNIGGLDQNGMELMWWPTQNVTKYPCKLPFILFYFVFVENNKSYKMCHPDNDWHPAADEMKLKQAPITAIVSILLNETTNKGKKAKKNCFFLLACDQIE